MQRPMVLRGSLHVPCGRSGAHRLLPKLQTLLFLLELREGGGDTFTSSTHQNVDCGCATEYTPHMPVENVQWPGEGRLHCFVCQVRDGEAGNTGTQYLPMAWDVGCTFCQGQLPASLTAWTVPVRRHRQSARSAGLSQVPCRKAVSASLWPICTLSAPPMPLASRALASVQMPAVVTDSKLWGQLRNPCRALQFRLLRSGHRQDVGRPVRDAMGRWVPSKLV